MLATFVATFDGWEYVPDDEDAIWLGVGLYGETRGGSSAAEWQRILWTWMNRFMLHGPRPRVWPSVAHLVAAHSQPVNPKWREGGKYCPAPEPGTNCSPSRLRWRAKMASLIDDGFAGLDGIPADQFAYLLEFLSGNVPQPDTVDGTPLLDFGMTLPARRFGTKYEEGGNYFLTRRQLQETNLVKDFMGGTVESIGGSGQPLEIERKGAAGWPYWVAGGGLIAVAAWLLWKATSL